MKATKLLIACVLIVLAVSVPHSRAEESGTGHYTPGTTASFMDALPEKPGLAVANFFCYYHGKADATKTLPVGGFIAAGLNATVYSDTIVALYRTDLELLGGNYVAGAAVPYIWMTTKGNVQTPGSGGTTISLNRRDTANGLGDITLYPFMIAWSGLGGDLKYNFMLGAYVPTGEYNKSDLANAGMNFWTFEPMVSACYLGSKTGIELSAYAGFDFNTKNTDTEYRTGDEFHLDATAAQHFPLFGGLAGIGATGFYYRQVTGDSGSGAVLGDHKGRTAGVGPVLSYVFKSGLAAEMKWLPEIDVSNRTKGDYVWFKMGMQF